MKPINEDEAEILIEEHLRERGWNITDLTVTRKRWRDHLEGEEEAENLKAIRGVDSLEMTPTWSPYGHTPGGMAA